MKQRALHLRFLRSAVGLAVLAALSVSVGCRGVSDLEPIGRVEALRRHPADGRIQTEPGKTFTVIVQAVDENDDGVNDLPVFFAVSDRTLASFTAPGAAERDWIALNTAKGEVDDIQASGVAQVEMKVSADATGLPKTVLVWVGLAARLPLATESDASADASNFPSALFTVTVEEKKE